MTESELIKDLCGREIAHDLYDVKIDGENINNLLCYKNIYVEIWIIFRD